MQSTEGQLTPIGGDVKLIGSPAAVAAADDGEDDDDVIIQVAMSAVKSLTRGHK